MEYTHLTMEERREIGNCLLNRFSLSRIAEELGRSVATISREIKRSGCVDRRNYSPLRAERFSLERKSLKQPKIEYYPELKSIIESLLLKGLSPEMISGRMKMEKKLVTISTESIYKYIYSAEGIKKTLPKLLCRHRPKRGNWKFSRKTRSEKNKKTPLSARPAIAAYLEELGHFETDLFFAHGSQSTAIAVTIEKKSRLARLRKVESKKSECVIPKVSESIKSYGLDVTSSITTDNGSEFANFKQLEKDLSTTVYFCDPHSPWQKPQVESLNNILRRFIPRSMSIKKLSADILAEVEMKLNNLPRKCLGFKTPIEAFGEAYV